MKTSKRIAKLAFALTILLFAGRANATVLGIPPIAQQTPEWCFAASSAMIMQYLGYPNLNPGGDYQCGVVGAQGGACAVDCRNCPGPGGTIQHVALILRSYATVAYQRAGYQNPAVNLQEFGILQPAQIIDQINRDGPILAGISPNSVAYPPGSGMSQHAVAIVGYDGNASNLNVIINDPYPYPAGSNPYLATGNAQLQPGQYRVPFGTFVSFFHYGDSLTFR
jgi:hypothetical protein